MHSLYLKNNQDIFTLHGEGISPPLRGCSRQPSQRLNNGHCLERLLLVIQGTPAQGRQILARLQSFLERIRQGHPVNIHLQVEDRGDVYQSKVYEGDFNWVISSVQIKGFGIQLELERDDFWEASLFSLPLTNRYGAQISGGIRVDNRSDAGGENQVTWEAEDVLGELSAPAQLLIHHDLDSAHQFDRITCGMLRGINNSIPVVEGELVGSGVSFSTVMDANCNGGSFGSAQWSGTGEERLFSWILSGVFSGPLTGLPLRPYLRFPPDFTCEQNIWVYWTLEQDGLIYQSEARRLEPERQLQDLPILRFPAVCLPYNDLASVQVNLIGKAVGEGTHTLEVDAVFFLGLDGFRQYQAQPGGALTNGRTLMDFPDQVLPVVLDSQSQQISRNFQMLGQGIQVTPNEHQALQILLEQGSAMPVDASLRLELRYRPRIRVLP
jgi:hypothetical protein